jgi:hypothetical protein
MNPIVAALKTKYSKNIIKFKQSNDVSWMCITRDCEGDLLHFREPFVLLFALTHVWTRPIHRSIKDNSGIRKRHFVNGSVDVCWNCASIIYGFGLCVKRKFFVPAN